jgi:capsid assembly protease
MLMLCNETALADWRERVELLAAPKMANLQAMSGRVESYSDWWQSIKAKNEGPDFHRHGSVAVVSVQGVLEHHYSIASYLYDSDSYNGIAAKVTAAAADQSIDHIVLQVHSPGGSHMGCHECADAVWQARQSKRVTAVVDYEAASAAYYIASQATSIVGLGSGWVGSIGTQIVMHSMARMYEKMGIDVELIRAAVSPLKNQGHPIEPISDAARQERQGWVDRCADEFISAVARGRGVTAEDVKKRFGRGAMVFMSDALRVGMVDSVGRLGDVVQAQKLSKITQKMRSESHYSDADVAAINSL